MTSVRFLDPYSPHVQQVLFRPSHVPRNRGEVIAPRLKSMRQLLDGKWQKVADLVCMLDGWGIPPEKWERRLKGKRLEIQYLDHDTLVPHEVSPEHKRERSKQ
jgi:hypothetical protein